MSDTIQKYKDYVMTGFVKNVAPIVIDRASGATVTDVNGREYLDCFAGISVVNAGHCNPAVAEAAKRQIDKLIHCSSYLYHVQPVADLAEKMAEITPKGLTKTFFGNGGAEAIEGALKLARLYSGKHEFISLQSSFHGRSFGALSITGNYARKKKGGPYGTGVSFAPAPYAYRSLWPNDPDECARQCARALDDVVKYATSNDVAAFIAEPVMGEGGIIVPPANYFKEVKKVLDHYGILFIADEVQCGFARTGRMFAIEYYGVTPDIIVTAKGIADGFPLSAYTTRPEIAAAYTPGDHLSTFGGNPGFVRGGTGEYRVHAEDGFAGTHDGSWELRDGQVARTGENESDHWRRAGIGLDDWRGTGEGCAENASVCRGRSGEGLLPEERNADRSWRRRQCGALPTAIGDHEAAD